MGLVCFILGVLLGVIVMGWVCSGKAEELRDAIHEADYHKKRSAQWHDFWVKINNTHNAYQAEARKMNSIVRGDKGQFKKVNVDQHITALLKAQ